VQQVQQAEHQTNPLEEQMIDGGKLMRMRMNEGAQWENKNISDNQLSEFIKLNTQHSTQPTTNHLTSSDH